MHLYSTIIKLFDSKAMSSLVWIDEKGRKAAVVS